MSASEIEAFRAALPVESRRTVDRLRALIASADPRLCEGFKWNAPSFAVDGEHRVTLGIGRKAEVRVVLHRGAAKSDGDGFDFPDPDGLAAWPSPDRAVLHFRDVLEVEAKADALRNLVRRWIEVTA